MNLSAFVIELLKTNDCVIVPDFGGFIANYLPAASNSSGDQFYPPSKELVFNEKLRKNDGLLVNFVCEREGVGYLEARKMVSEFVSETLFRLENGQRIELEQIGTLHYDPNDHIVFEANDQYQNLRADAFGLGNFHFPHLVTKYNHPVKPVFKDKEPEPQTKRRPVIQYALLALPILAALYFIPKIFLSDLTFKQPNSNSASLSISDSPASKNPVTAVIQPEVKSDAKSDQMFSNNEVKEAIKLDEPSTATVINNPATSTVDSPVADQPQQSAAQSVANEPSSGKFHVVGGCFKIKENADKLVEQLIKKGFHAQVTNLGKSFYRVSVESYETRKEAELALVKLFESEPDADYWLMADK